jgi:hypothetical protein
LSYLPVLSERARLGPLCSTALFFLHHKPPSIHHRRQPSSRNSTVPSRGPNCCSCSRQLLALRYHSRCPLLCQRSGEKRTCSGDRETTRMTHLRRNRAPRSVSYRVNGGLDVLAESLSAHGPLGGPCSSCLAECVIALGRAATARKMIGLRIISKREYGAR